MFFQPFSAFTVSFVLVATFFPSLVLAEPVLISGKVAPQAAENQAYHSFLPPPNPADLQDISFPTTKNIEQPQNLPVSVDVIEYPDSIEVVVQPMKPVAKLLAKKYMGYLITLINHGPNVVTINQAEVTNGLTGEQAFEASRKGLIGPTSFLGASGFVTTAIRRKIKNNKARDEANSYNDSITEQVILVGEKQSFHRFVPIQDSPIVRVIAENNQTGENIEIQHVNYHSVNQTKATPENALHSITTQKTIK